MSNDGKCQPKADVGGVEGKGIFRQKKNT